MPEFDEVGGELRARWPGSLVVGSLKNRAQNKIEEYKQKLPKRANPRPAGEPSSQFRQLINRYHGHVTLVVLTGTLVNVLSKIYMGARYEDLQRLSYEKYHWRERADHWQHRGDHSEAAYQFWAKLFKEIDKQREDRRIWLQKVRFLRRTLEPASEPPIMAANWFQVVWRTLFSFYHKIQDHQQTKKLEKLEKICVEFEHWTEQWDELYRISQREMKENDKRRQFEKRRAISHAVGAVHWRTECSRDLVFHFQIPWTGTTINLWTAKWTDL